MAELYVGWSDDKDKLEYGTAMRFLFLAMKHLMEENRKPEDPEEFRLMQEKELSHCRLAMIAAAGFLAQEAVTGKTWAAEDSMMERLFLDSRW